MANPNAPRPSNDSPAPAADAAIASVLRAESEARAAIDRSRAEAAQLAEAARARARALAERTERRIRAVVTAFECERSQRLAEIEAEAAAIARPHRLTPEELAGLDRAVQALAGELTGGPP